MHINFYIPNPENPIIDVKVDELFSLTSDIASFCQGAQAASWTDDIVDEVMAYIWFGIEMPYIEPYISPDWTSRELKELLDSIKLKSEKLGWYVHNDDTLGHTYVPLKDAIEDFKVEKHFTV